MVVVQYSGQSCVIVLDIVRYLLVLVSALVLVKVKLVGAIVDDNAAQLIDEIALAWNDSCQKNLGYQRE